MGRDFPSWLWLTSPGCLLCHHGCGLHTGASVLPGLGSLPLRSRLQPPPRSLLQAGAAAAAPWEAVCTRELCVFILFLFCLISAPLGAPRSAGTSLRRLLLLEPLSPARWAARGAAAPSPQSAGGEIRLCSGARGHHSLGEKHTEVLPASSSTSLGRGGGHGERGELRGAWGACSGGALTWGNLPAPPPRAGPGVSPVALVCTRLQRMDRWTGRKPHRENHHRKNHLREYHHHFQGWPQRLAPPAALGGNRHPAGTDQPASA